MQYMFVMQNPWNPWSNVKSFNKSLTTYPLIICKQPAASPLLPNANCSWIFLLAMVSKFPQNPVTPNCQVLPLNWYPPFDLNWFCAPGPNTTQPLGPGLVSLETDTRTVPGNKTALVSHSGQETIRTDQGPASGDTASAFAVITGAVQKSNQQNSSTSGSCQTWKRKRFSSFQQLSSVAGFTSVCTDWTVR